MTSGLTFFCKYIFTSIWICGFGAGAAVIFAREGNAFLFIPWIVGATFLLWTWGKLKKIGFSPFNRKIYISNFIKEIEVSYDDVEDISAFPLITPALIFVSFKSTTAFGSRVLFMPKFKFFCSFSVHTTAEELRHSVVGK